MRARIIKPGFFKNDSLAELDPLARILFAGLWCLADREGRLKDRPKVIKAEVLPYDDADVSDMLDALQRAGFIRRYIMQHDAFIQVLNFGVHQNPHVREAASCIPALCLNGARHDLGDVEALPRSPVPITVPDSNSVPVSNETGRTRPRKPRAVRAVSARRTPEEMAMHEPALFVRLWTFFGHHGSCARAAAAWDKLKPTRDEMRVIKEAIERQRTAFKWGQEGGQTQPHLSTWLNDRRWEWDAIPNKVEGGY